MVYIDSNKKIHSKPDKKNKQHKPNINIIEQLSCKRALHLWIKILCLVVILYLAFSKNVIHQITDIHQRKFIIGIISIILITFIYVIKGNEFYQDDIFFISILLVVNIYIW